MLLTLLICLFTTFSDFMDFQSALLVIDTHNSPQNSGKLCSSICDLSSSSVLLIILRLMDKLNDSIKLWKSCFGSFVPLQELLCTKTLSIAGFAYNSTPHSSTGKTDFLKNEGLPNNPLLSALDLSNFLRTISIGHICWKCFLPESFCCSCWSLETKFR